MWLNQLATPGLGSLMARRWRAGGGQIALSLAGFALLMIWGVREFIQYYGQMFGEAPAQPIGWTGCWLGAGLFALAWCWSLWTSLNLLREASQAGLDSLENFATSLAPLSAAQIILALGQVPDWRQNGGVITRSFQFKDFAAAMEFTNAVAALAEQAQHHPDIDVRWNKVALSLSTHEAGGLTEKDFALARQCDALARR